MHTYIINNLHTVRAQLLETCCAQGCEKQHFPWVWEYLLRWLGSDKCICMSVCMYVCILHERKVWTQCMYVFIHCIHAHTHTYIHTYMHARTHTHTHTHTHIHTHHINLCMHMHTHTYTVRTKMSSKVWSTAATSKSRPTPRYTSIPCDFLW